MITLYQYEPGFTLRTLSPFALKLEAYMRMANIPYRVVFDGDPRKAPEGKIPYITDGDGPKLGDSALIIEYLVKKHGNALRRGSKRWRSRSTRSSCAARAGR